MHHTPETPGHQHASVPNSTPPDGTIPNDTSPNGSITASGTSPAQRAKELRRSWRDDPRWDGVERPYDALDVLRLRGSIQEEHTLARRGAERLWRLLHERDYVHALGALTGNQAVQQVRAGLEAIYLSGWQVAADNTGEWLAPIVADAEAGFGGTGLQTAEFASESCGYTAVRHQREVGAGHFDLVDGTITPESSTTALSDSTEQRQFSTVSG